MAPGCGTRSGAGLLALVVTLTLAGCSKGSSAPPEGRPFTSDQSSRFVIAKGDLPPEYKRSEPGGVVECGSGYLANQGAPAETPSEAAVKQELLALGPRGCRMSSYERRIANSVTGFSVFVAVFPDDAAASRSLPLFRSSLSDPMLRESYGEDGATLPAGEDIATTGLGDESTPGIKRTLPIGRVGDPQGVIVTTDYIWRVRNVALRMTGGFPIGELTEADALQVAKNISARANKR